MYETRKNRCFCISRMETLHMKISRENCCHKKQTQAQGNGARSMRRQAVPCDFGTVTGFQEPKTSHKESKHGTHWETKRKCIDFLLQQEITHQLPTPNIVLF